MADNPRTKVFRASNQSNAAVEIAETHAALIGNKSNFFLANENGLFLKGPISIIADAMGVRTGGLFVGINDFLHLIPSTIITPIPTKIPVPPIQGLTRIASDVAFFISLLV